jgi:putative ABC transport system permease protein
MNIHVSLYELAFLATVFVGLTFGLLLLLTRRINRVANRFLGLAALTMVCWIGWVLGIAVRLQSVFPHWDWLPLQYSLTLGPLLYFYVRHLTEPQLTFKRKDLWHFSPLLLEQLVLIQVRARTLMIL